MLKQSGLLVLMVVVVMLAISCGESEPTATASPSEIRTVEEIGQVYKTNPSVGRLRFEEGTGVFVSDHLQAFHSEKDEAFFGLRRNRNHYTTLRMHASTEQLARLVIGNRVFFHCGSFSVDEHSAIYGFEYRDVREFVCKDVQIIRAVDWTPGRG